MTRYLFDNRTKGPIKIDLRTGDPKTTVRIIPAGGKVAVSLPDKDTYNRLVKEHKGKIRVYLHPDEKKRIAREKLMVERRKEQERLVTARESTPAVAGPIDTSEEESN